MDGAALADAPGRPEGLVAEIVFFAAAASAFASAQAPVVGVVYGAVAIGCSVLIRYAGEPEVREPGPTPAA